MDENQREMEQKEVINMSVRPKTPQLPDVPPGLAALSSAAAAALQNQEKSSAIDLQNAATLGQHKEPTVIPQEASVGLSLLKDGDNGGGSLSSMDEHNMAAGRAYTTSPPSVSRDESEIVREKISFTCTYEQKHLIGQFCFHCRAMEMPWGDQHPIALDTSGNKIIIAPQGSLLEGVKNLTEPYEIAQLALIIEFRIIQQNLDSIPGLVESLRFFRNLHDVAHRIANLAQELETLADEDERERVPRWFNILHELLKQPTLTRDQYFARATEKWNLQPINGAIHKAKSPAPIIPSFQLLSRAFTGTPVMLNREEAIANDAQTHSEAQVEELINHLDRNESRGPGYVQFTLDFVGWLREGAHGTGRGAPQWGPRYVQEYHDLRHSRTVVARRSSRNDASRFTGRLDFLCGRNSAPTTPVRSEEEPDVEVYDSNESEEDEQWNFRRIPEKKKNTPGRANVKWRFVEGTDIENAVLGQPDPSKFYFTRYNVDNPMEVDLRQFPGIAGFDWNDPKDIKKLNKARAQNRKRTHGNIAETRVPWTQMEKACLVEEVEEAINAGFNRKTIEWDDIAARLKSRFEGVLQKKGSKLAPGVEREPKNGQKDKTLKTSRSDRIGFNRTGSATETQALKYPDILKMVNEATGLGGKGGRGLLRGPRRSLSQVVDDATRNSDKEDASVLRGPRRSLSEMTDNVRDEANNRPTKKAKTIPRRLSVSPPPQMYKKNHNNDDDDRPSPQPKRRSAVQPDWSLKFTKSNAKQFDANPSRN